MQAKETKSSANRKRVLKFTDTQGEKTLETKEKLDLAKYDTVNMIDPLFKKTTQMFDGITASKLMSAILPINEDLRLLLDSNMKNVGNVDQDQPDSSD